MSEANVEIRTLPTNAIPDEQQPDDEQVALAYSANDETAVPSDDDTDWWLPDEADMIGPHPSWEHRSGAWCPAAK